MQPRMTQALSATPSVSIDLGRVRRLVGDFAQVMEEPERVAELERLLRRIERR